MQKTHLNRAGYASLRRSTEPAGLLLLLKDALRSWLQIAVPTSLSAAEDATEAAVGLEDWPSLDIVYEEIRDSITAQNDRISAIDTKVNYGLVSGTLLTAGVTGLGRALVDAGQRTSAPSWNILGAAVSANLVVDWVTIASLGAYALLVVGVFSAYRLRTFKEAPNPQRLVTKYVYEDPRITKATITAVRAKNYASNEKAIERKVWWTNFTMVFLIVEALLLFVIAVIQVMWL